LEGKWVSKGPTMSGEIGGMSGFIKALRGQGYRRALCAVLPENRLAFLPVHRVGYQRIGVMGYMSLWRWRWSFYRADARARPPGGLR
jgi:hypothetical protein